MLVSNQSKIQTNFKGISPEFMKAANTIPSEVPAYARAQIAKHLNELGLSDVVDLSMKSPKKLYLKMKKTIKNCFKTKNGELQDLMPNQEIHWDYPIFKQEGSKIICKDGLGNSKDSIILDFGTKEEAQGALKNLDITELPDQEGFVTTKAPNVDGVNVPILGVLLDGAYNMGEVIAELQNKMRAVIGKMMPNMY